MQFPFNEENSQNVCMQRNARVIYFELKAPGGSSTRWTLNSYDKDNSFTFTGPRFHSMSLQSFKCPYDRKVFLGFGISNI